MTLIDAGIERTYTSETAGSYDNVPTNRIPVILKPVRVAGAWKILPAQTEIEREIRGDLYVS